MDSQSTEWRPWTRRSAIAFAGAEPREQDTVRPPPLREEPQPRGGLNVVLALARDDACFGEAKRPRPPTSPRRSTTPAATSSSRSAGRRGRLSWPTTMTTSRRSGTAPSPRSGSSRPWNEADSLGLSRRHLSYLTLESDAQKVLDPGRDPVLPPESDRAMRLAERLKRDYLHHRRGDFPPNFNAETAKEPLLGLRQKTQDVVSRVRKVVVDALRRGRHEGHGGG